MDMQSILRRLNSTTHNWYVDWLYGGVDFSIDGNGGETCARYLPPWTRLVESAVMILVAGLEIVLCARKLTYEGHEEDCNDENETEDTSGGFRISSENAPVAVDCVVRASKNVDATRNKDSWPWMKRALLVFLCLVFGIEIGYKFATKSVIYLLNPCHMLNFMQIYLLASDHQKKSKVVNTVFRIHLYSLNGPLLAMIFYVVNTRFLPFEQGIYWIQHILLYLVPIYLISLGGSYTPDALSDLRWAVMSIGVSAMYHFAVLQSIGLLTWTNLNNMLCPAVSDPFEGQHYRKWACTHQHLMIIVHGKLYVLLARLLIRLLAAVQSFFVAVTVKTWRWTIHLVLTSTKACVPARSKGKSEKPKTKRDQHEPCSITKPKIS